MPANSNQDAGPLLDNFDDYHYEDYTGADELPNNETDLTTPLNDKGM